MGQEKRHITAKKYSLKFTPPLGTNITDGIHFLDYTGKAGYALRYGAVQA
jgi:hypothetical protein